LITCLFFLKPFEGFEVISKNLSETDCKGNAKLLTHQTFQKKYPIIIASNLSTNHLSSKIHFISKYTPIFIQKINQYFTAITAPTNLSKRVQKY